MRALSPALVPLLAAGLLTAGCHGPAPEAARSHHARPGFATDTAEDPGAAMLAGVDNARAALASGDQLAAYNDLSQAATYSTELPGASSGVFPDNGPNLAPGPSKAARGQNASQGASQGASLARFAAQVRLESADAELQAGDLRAADADLQAVQAGVPAQLIPANLPLLRAQQTLALAEGAVESDHPGDLTTQLTSAEAALKGYAGQAHQADAHALAAEIGQALGQAGGAHQIASDQLTVWAQKVGGWV